MHVFRTRCALIVEFGIREHICEVLEGGQLAFEERERKYASSDKDKSGPTGGPARQRKRQLSTLVDKLNERFGTEFTPADQLFFDQVKETAGQRAASPGRHGQRLENFEPVFNKQLENLFVGAWTATKTSSYA